MEKCEDILRKQIQDWDSFIEQKENTKSLEVLTSQITVEDNVVKKEADDSEFKESQKKIAGTIKAQTEEMVIGEGTLELKNIKKENEEINMGTEETMHGCKVCSFRSKRFNNLKTHVERTHLRLRFYCKLCDVQFKDRGTLKSHIKSKTDEDSSKFIILECGACLYRGTGEEFINHVENKHMVVYDIFKPASKDRKEEIKQPNIQIKEEVEEKKQFIKKPDLSKMEKGTNYPITNQVKKEDFKCEFCAKDFSGRNQASSLRWSHIASLHMRVVYKCDQCNYEIATKSTLYNHIDENHVHKQ